MSRTRKLDMLSGSIWDKMILFALPLAFTGVLQQLYNAADVAVLGHFVSDEAMAAVGNNVPIIGLIVSLCMGLALGANVVVAQALGMRDEERASRGFLCGGCLRRGHGDRGRNRGGLDHRLS